MTGDGSMDAQDPEVRWTSTRMLILLWGIVFVCSIGLAYRYEATTGGEGISRTFVAFGIFLFGQLACTGLATLSFWFGRSLAPGSLRKAISVLPLLVQCLVVAAMCGLAVYSQL